MPYTKSKKGSHCLSDTDAQYVAFLKTALRSLLTHKETQAIISSEYDDFVRGCNANVAAFRPEAKNVFDLCLAEWLLANRFVEYKGTVEAVADVYASICSPRPAAHLRSYMEGLAGSHLSLYRVLPAGTGLMLQDMLHNDRQVQYNALLPKIHEGEIAGLRLFTLNGVQRAGFGIYRFVADIGQKLTESIKRDIRKCMHQMPGTDMNTLDMTLVMDRIVHAWVTQISAIESKRQQ